MDKKMRGLKKFKLALMVAVIVFLILFITILVVGAVMFALIHSGAFPEEQNFFVPLQVFALSSLVVGTVLAFGISRQPLAPVYKMMDATEQIADAIIPSVFPFPVRRSCGSSAKSSTIWRRNLTVWRCSVLTL